MRKLEALERVNPAPRLRGDTLHRRRLAECRLGEVEQVLALALGVA